jgi:hypothetical protein
LHLVPARDRQQRFIQIDTRIQTRVGERHLNLLGRSVVARAEQKRLHAARAEQRVQRRFDLPPQVVAQTAVLHLHGLVRDRVGAIPDQETSRGALVGIRRQRNVPPLRPYAAGRRRNRPLATCKVLRIRRRAVVEDQLVHVRAAERAGELDIEGNVGKRR